MFNSNKGYVGKSRSVRSQEAIADYEVPMSMISKRLIESFLNENNENFSEEDFRYLEKTSVAKWKFVAKQKVCAASWHHTSKFFNATDHYALGDIATFILDNKQILDIEYKEFLAKNKPSEAQLATQLAKRAEKRAVKERIEEKQKLFRYQKKYKSLGGFLRSSMNLEPLKEIRKNKISQKREELRAMWKKQLPLEHDIWQCIDKDEFIERYIKDI